MLSRALRIDVMWCEGIGKLARGLWGSDDFRRARACVRERERVGDDEKLVRGRSATPVAEQKPKPYCDIVHLSTLGPNPKMP